MKAPKRPRDMNQLAKLIVDLSTGEAAPEPKREEGKKAAAGRLGGLKGGTARAIALPRQRRQAIARAAAKARWQRS